MPLSIYAGSAGSQPASNADAWLARKDSNLEPRLQRAVCYHYTTGQSESPGEPGNLPINTIEADPQQPDFTGECQAVGSRRLSPVMADGFSSPSMSNRVGATSAKMPFFSR